MRRIAVFCARCTEQVDSYDVYRAVSQDIRKVDKNMLNSV